MDRLKTIRLLESNDSRARGSAQKIRAQIVPGLYSEERDKADFLFVPVRCGINALIWNIDALPNFPRVRRYRDLWRLLDPPAKSNSRLKLSEIGLYDTMGGTLPILIMMALDDMKMKEVFKARGGDLGLVCSGLKDLTDKHGCKFSLYARAEDLAYDLQSRKIKFVLGGGAWLGQPVLVNKSRLRCHLPKSDGGLLWVEGAAMTNGVGDKAPDLVDFLSSSVLGDDYQISLANRDPYGSSPVTIKGVEYFTSRRCRAAPGLGLIDRETKTIYAQDGDINRLLTHRVRPDEYKYWIDAWNEITLKYCDRKGEGEKEQ
jgi:hypothetical protein